MSLSKRRVEGPTAVVFDVGNVLYGWDPDSFYRRRFADDEACDRFLASTGFLDWHGGLDAGRPFTEAAAELAGRFPEHADLINAWDEDFHRAITGPVPGVHELVAQLEERGVALFAITNFSAEFWKPFREREAALFDRFRGIVVSGAEKLMKPDLAIYRLALERFGLRAERALFVDDRPENVAAAEAVGMAGHLFTSADDLKRRLVAEGLL